MVEEPVDDVRRLARGRRQKLGVERRVATGEVGVEGDDGLAAVPCVDRADRLAGTTDGKVLPVRARDRT